MSGRPRLRALATRLGVIDAYRAAGTREICPTSDDTREALAGAMGFDASTERAAGEALRALDARERARLLEPVRVVHGPLRGAQRLAARLPPGARGRLDWSLELELEGGELRRRAGKRALRSGAHRIGLELPAGPLPLGYHRLRLTLESGSLHSRAEQLLAVAPERCVEPRELLGGRGGRRGFGLATNLYTLRSARSWGAGDLGDLRALVRLAGRAGAAFVGMNPLHALWNRGSDINPYAPISRLYRSELYLEVERIPELADCRAARARLGSRELRAALERARRDGRVRYEEVAAHKRELLELLHASFVARHRGRATPRGRAFERYRAGHGERLERYATFRALAEDRAGRGRKSPRDWRAWPAAYRDPDSPAVERFRSEQDAAIDLHRWIQFELDRQLGGAAAAARRAGLSVGLYQDLAVGSSAAGSDLWAHRAVFATGARVGAPPDPFAPDGQDWGFPPLDPRRLRESGFGFWIELLRASLRHAGALRIDHAMALRRLYWIPEGLPAAQGAYVRYPERELLGILALESRRQGALVIAEDLGTVPRGLAAALARAGVLSSRVLYFERTRSGGFRPSRSYSPRALCSVNTHDLAPLAGWASGRDLELRRAVGHLADDDALAAARRERAGEVDALLRRLAAEGIACEPDDAAGLCAATARFLSRTPSPLVALALDDLALEREPVNLPGVPSTQFPSWTRRMGAPLESLAGSETWRATMRAISSRGSRSGSRR